MLNPIRRWRWRRLARHRSASAAAGGLAALASELPPPSTPIKSAPLLAIDLEMTGLEPARDAILSIGWVPIRDGRIDLAGAREVRLARGGGEWVGQSATIHGIRDCDREGGVAVVEALEMLLEAAAGRVAVFHHAPLDTAFLERALRRACGVGWLVPWIDTLDWFRRRQRRRGHDDTAAAATRLSAVRDHYGLAPRAAHGALDDALSCAEVVMILAARSHARLIDICSLPGPGKAAKARPGRAGSERDGVLRP
ncbi:MAG: 3'-5' exonuclease [Wenzhouxiangellaceae bacterium]|nr:3'-5' exonuclease [Wenzhouxiangellaceae bacterium]